MGGTDYGRGRLRLRATPATGVRSRCPRFPLMGCCRTLRHPSPANAQLSGTSPSPCHARLSLTPHPARRTRHHPAYVAHRHRTSETCPSPRLTKTLASTQPRETHPSPTHTHLSLAPPQRDMSVTNPHTSLTKAEPTPVTAQDHCRKKKEKPSGGGIPEGLWS